MFCLKVYLYYIRFASFLNSSPRASVLVLHWRTRKNLGCSSALLFRLCLPEQTTWQLWPELLVLKRSVLFIAMSGRSEMGEITNENMTC